MQYELPAHITDTHTHTHTHTHTVVLRQEQPAAILPEQRHRCTARRRRVYCHQPHRAHCHRRHASGACAGHPAAGPDLQHRSAVLLWAAWPAQWWWRRLGIVTHGRGQAGGRGRHRGRELHVHACGWQCADAVRISEEHHCAGQRVCLGRRERHCEFIVWVFVKRNDDSVCVLREMSQSRLIIFLFNLFVFCLLLFF